MNNTSWTEEEIKFLKSEPDDRAVARRLRRSEAAVRGKRQRLDAEAGGNSDVAETPTYEADKEAAASDYWRKQYRALTAKYERALKEQSSIEQLVAAIKDMAPASYSPAPEIKKLTRGSGKPQSMVLLLSDTHVGQTIRPEQTLGHGCYNFDVFLARLKFYEESVTSILRDHTTTEVPEIIVAMGGDMLDGALNHSAEAGQTTTMFSQFYGAGHAISQFLRNLSALVPRLRIHCTVGNHPRWPNQHKMPTDNRFSNFDQVLYAYLQALTKDIRTIQWTLDEQPFALFKVQNLLCHLSHGDQLSGGDKALGIPNHAVGRMVSSNSQLFGKDSSPSPDIYLVGHLHRQIVLPHAKGSVIVNGGFPGVGPYGLIRGFSPVDPTQVCFFVHPVYGQTATYTIQLKHAKVEKTRPYEIPTGFNL